MGFFRGKKARTEDIQRYSPEHNALLDQISKLAMGELEDPYSDFEPIADKARSDYRTKDIPYLAE